MQFTTSMEPKNRFRTRNILYLILISLLILLLTWSWFDRRIAAIDEKIEMLQTR